MQLFVGLVLYFQYIICKDDIKPFKNKLFKHIKKSTILKNNNSFRKKKIAILFLFNKNNIKGSHFESCQKASVS